MKALPLLLAVVFFAGCDMKKITGVLESATPVPTPAPTPMPKPVPSTPKPGEWLLDGKRNPLDGRKLAEPKSGAAPRPGAPPTPVPKQGDWMLKGYKNPLDQPKR